MPQRNYIERMELAEMAQVLAWKSSTQSKLDTVSNKVTVLPYNPLNIHPRVQTDIKKQVNEK